MRKFMGTVFIVILVMFFAGCIISISSLTGKFQVMEKPLKASILKLDLEGIIIDPDKLLKDIRKYAKEDSIKGVLIRVNSPGGVVGPSQEIFAELQRVRDELKKPVVVSAGSLIASGAYYAAAGADLIFVNQGSLVGSIGVIMEFANLKELYQWAKIKPYAIKTGEYKDSGAPYREMREDEREYFQSMADEILVQFKKAIVDGRKLSPNLVDQYADGRVFTGATAVRLKFADKIGTFEDAKRAIGELTELGQDPELYEPPPERPSLSELLAEVSSNVNPAASAIETLHLKLIGQPLYIMPSSLSFGR